MLDDGIIMFVNQSYSTLESTVHGVALTYMQAWRAKQRAIKLVQRDPNESYAKLLGSLWSKWYI